MDTWIVVALVAWSGVALLLALLVGRALTRSEREERAALSGRRPLAPARVVVPIRPAGHSAGASDPADGASSFPYRQRSAS